MLTITPEVVNWTISLLMMVITLGLFYWFCRWLFWPLVETIEEKSRTGVQKLGSAVEKLVKGFKEVWNWMAATKPVSATKPATQEEYPLNRVVSGVVCLCLATFCCYVDYYLLTVAFEILFRSSSGIQEGYLTLPEASALSLLFGLLISGMLWLDADLIASCFGPAEQRVGGNKAENENMSAIGKWLLIALAAFAGNLGGIRAITIGRQNLLIALITGIFTGLVSYLVAYSFSIAFRGLIYPLGQRVVKGTENYWPSVGLVFRFLFALVAWLVLTGALLVATIVFGLASFPAFLVAFHKKVKEWRKEREEGAVKRWEMKVAIKKWKWMCDLARQENKELPPFPHLRSPEKSDLTPEGGKA